MTAVRRLFAATVGACAFVLVSAWVALASSTYPPSSTQSVEATSGSQPPGGSAFTGSDSGRLMLVAGVLLVVGLVALALARRRARTYG